jgi:hypothetical protein
MHAQPDLQPASINPPILLAVAAQRLLSRTSYARERDLEVAAIEKLQRDVNAALDPST